MRCDGWAAENRTRRKLCGEVWRGGMVAVVMVVVAGVEFPFSLRFPSLPHLSTSLNSFFVGLSHFSGIGKSSAQVCT